MVLTIGHSTRPLSELIELLESHDVVHLVDVRSLPRSSRHPHFNRERLQTALPERGISYTHLPGLGGMRRPRPDSANRGLRNAGFRGFADHMDSAAFATDFEALIRLAARERVAIMCAEALPGQCHRSLIADALMAREIAVEHILGPDRRDPHVLSPRAHVRAGRVSYPGPEECRTAGP